MYNTFNGWKLQGRRVALGERGSHRNEYGDYMFHKSQTVPLNKTIRYDSFGRPYVRSYL